MWSKVFSEAAAEGGKQHESRRVGGWDPASPAWPTGLQNGEIQREGGAGWGGESQSACEREGGRGRERERERERERARARARAGGCAATRRTGGCDEARRWLLEMYGEAFLSRRQKDESG